MRVTLICGLISLSTVASSLLFTSWGWAEQGSVAIRLNSQIATLDWNKAATAREAYLISHLMRGLFRISEGLVLTPDLCDKYSVSDDGLSYRIFVKGGVYWSDGVPLKAKDFIDSWKRLLSPGLAAEYQFVLHDIVGASEFSQGRSADFSTVWAKALNDREIEIRLSRRSPMFLNRLSLVATYPIREDVILKHGNMWASPGRAAVLGPFTLESNKSSGEEITLVRTLTDSEKKRGLVRRVIARVVRDDEVAAGEFRSGKLDYVPYLGRKALEKFRTDPRVVYVDPLRVMYLRIDDTKFPTMYPEIRRAIGMAISRDRATKAIGGNRIPATSFVIPGIVGHSPDVGIKFDPATARRLMQKADAKNSKVILDLLYLDTDTYRSVAADIKAQLESNLGLTINLLARDQRTFDMQSSLKSSALSLAGWSADFPHGDNFLSIFSSASFGNISPMKSPDYDDEIQAALYSRDPAAVAHHYRRAQKILQEERAYIVPLYYDKSATLISNRLPGFRPANPFGARFESAILVEQE